MGTVCVERKGDMIEKNLACMFGSRASRLNGQSQMIDNRAKLTRRGGKPVRLRRSIVVRMPRIRLQGFKQTAQMCARIEFDLRYSEFRHARSFAAIEVVLMLERAS
jgi:hypothetical protein